MGIQTLHIVVRNSTAKILLCAKPFKFLNTGTVMSVLALAFANMFSSTASIKIWNTVFYKKQGLSIL